MPEGAAPPPEVVDLAERRASARTAREWDVADALRGEIEAAGWKILDSGAAFTLQPAHPPDVLEPARTSYGRSASVPSRLGEPATAPATVILVATDWLDDVRRAIAALERHGPPATQLIVVADGSSAVQAELASSAPEIVWTSAPLGQAAALNAGIRGSMGGIVVLADPSVEATGDAVTPLVQALADPSVAVAGAWGLVSDDLRRFREAPGSVDAIEGYWLGFRRDAYLKRGPLDERFRFYRNLDIWWSLVLRDEGTERPPRSALALPGLPLVRHEHRGWTSLSEAERDRLSRRNFYRIIDRFGGRRDLLVGGDRPAGS